MNKLQALLITLLCFGFGSCGLTGLNERTKLKTKELSTNEPIINLEENTNSLSNKTALSIMNQTEKHWRPPVSTKNLKDLRVILHITLNKDGIVNDVSTKDIICPPNADETCKLTAESCIKAVKEASPYKLRAEEYKDWKDFNMLFDPIAEDEKPTRNVYVEVPKD